MKTVFGHALIEEGYNAPIYNVKFDQTGKFVISGADDGIIKVWDKDTFNLQAALHSHEDVITDMDISKCNTYLATASKDGKIIVWDWQKCTKVDEIVAHEGAVTNIKFFSLKIKNKSKDQKKEVEEIQILVTCSEDGTIKLYDEISFLTSQSLSSQDGQARRNRTRHEPVGHQKDRYYVTLTPEDYRPGAKNKKIDSVHINQNGLLAAGSGKGDIFLWEIDLHAFKRRQQKAANWLGSSKKHAKTVHFCEFSPNGRFLFTGSIDGTAKVWNVEREKSKKSDPSQKILVMSDDRMVVSLEEKRRNWQCDSLAWSCNARYGIVSLSGKVEEENNKEISIIKVWDSYTGSIIQDLAKGNNIQLLTFSFVIAPHPKIDEIFFSGSDGGTICLWNIKTRTLIKKFLEYGIYSFEKYTMNDPYDGRFSPDGSSFVVGSVMGTISLFSCEGADYKYQTTRVEQFYPSDNNKHNQNIYYKNDQNVEPQICGYSLIPYEIQPPSSLIGKFKEARKFTPEEYERSYLIRRELCIEEENFIQGQLEEGLRNNLFNADNEPGYDFVPNEADIDDDENIEQRRGNARIRADSQLSQISQNINNNVASQEDVEALDGIVDAERRRPLRGRRQNIVSRVNRMIMNPNYDPDNDLYDRESDENFEVVPEEIDNSEEEEDFEQSDSDEDYGRHTANRGNLQRQDRLNVRQQAMHILRQEESKRREDSRALRAQRRQARMGDNLDNDEEDKIETRTRSTRRRPAIEDSEDEEANSNDYSFSDQEQKPNSKRRLVKNNGRGNNNQKSEDDSMDSDMISLDDDEDEYDDDSDHLIKTRSNRNIKKQKSKEQKERQKRKNLRSRKNRKNYQGMDESSEEEYDNNSDSEEEKQASGKSQEEEKHGSQGRKRRAVIKDSDEEMIDADVVLPDDKSKKLKGDEDYELINPQENQIQLQEDMIEDPNHSKKCAFCLRIDQPLIGPFVKYGNKKQIVHGPLYFHKDCIEVNNYSFFNKQKNKWMNIGKALEQFTKKPCMCSRCGQIGATIKCSDCFKFYHGHLCSQLYMIWIGGQSYQCFECRNKANYRMFRDKEPQLEKSEIKIMKRQIPREYLLFSKQNIKTYIPQVRDEVYYFFQGHERFISFYNCYFYCGDSDTISFEYPWKIHPDYLENPTLCRIRSISYRFPQKNALYLIKKYGKSQAIQQTPQVITHLELEIVDSDEDLFFTVDLFPNDLPDFLILKDVYELAIKKFEYLQAEKKLIGQVFKSRCKNLAKVRIVDIQQREPTFYPNTNWETVLYRHEEAYRLRERGRRGLRRDPEELEPPEVMNFWELVLNENGNEEEEEKQFLKEAFTPQEKERMVNIMREYIEKKKDDIQPFMTRVTEQIAPDYRQHIMAEMYFGLVEERLFNGFYRSQEQFYFDLDLIATNARIYNGDENPLSSLARKIVEKLKREIKSSLSQLEETKQKDDTKICVSLKPAGKLTAPTRFDTAMTTMDFFKKAQEEKDNHQSYGQSRRRHYNEESKGSSNTLLQNQSKTKKQELKYQQSNDMIMNEYNVQIEASHEQEYKVTPKTPAGTFDMNNGNRRLTRQTNKINNNESYMDSMAFSTEEKHHDHEQNGISDQVLLGKRTRSGRQSKVVKQSLNEDESDKDFEDKILDSNQLNGSRKRLRHH